MPELGTARTGLAERAVVSAGASTVRWRIFAIVFFLVVINLIDRVTLSIAMPTISKEFSLEPAHPESKTPTPPDSVGREALVAMIAASAPGGAASPHAEHDDE